MEWTVFVVVAEEEGRWRESKEDLQDGEGLNFEGEAGDPLRPEDKDDPPPPPPPPLAKEVVEPSLATERSAVEDNEGEERDV